MQWRVLLLSSCVVVPGCSIDSGHLDRCETAASCASFETCYRGFCVVDEGPATVGTDAASPVVPKSDGGVTQGTVPTVTTPDVGEFAPISEDPTPPEPAKNPTPKGPSKKDEKGPTNGGGGAKGNGRGKTPP